MGAKVGPALVSSSDLAPRPAVEGASVYTLELRARRSQSVSPQVYQILHMGGFALVFVALGGMASFALQGAGAAVAEGESAPARPKLWAILHGVGLLLLLVAGFGAFAKLGYKGAPGWVLGKVAIWILLGGTPVILKRAPQVAKGAVIALPLIALGAAALAILKPGA